jgi:CheY-like chemotaxis protein
MMYDERHPRALAREDDVNTSDDAVFAFAEELPPPPPARPWRVLVVDDDEEIFLVTEMTLRRTRVDGAPLELVYASSGDEARRRLQTEGPFAVAVLDVVMETPTAGLELCQWIREHLGDHDVRLLVRTGQPGGASDETKVAEEYDIHDFLAKTETTGRSPGW